MNFLHTNALEIVPFFLMILSLALLPVLAPAFWDKLSNKLIVSVILSLPVLFFLGISGRLPLVEETMLFDFLPFIILIGSLFVITGGIYINISLKPDPGRNAIILLCGAVLASLIGTTGAATLLIRPLLHVNKRRKLKTHTILFFIAIVANAGGLLTPLGDPPLFILFLRGVPFTWFFKLLPFWALTNGLLIGLFYITDSYFFRKEDPEHVKFRSRNLGIVAIQGKRNFIFLGGVIAAVAFINSNVFSLIAANEYLRLLRECVILAMLLLSMYFTPRKIQRKNKLTHHPVTEVVYLFLGIFITMVPCIEYLRANAQSLPLTHPYQFYLASGILSSILDNTPTAVTFYSVASGLGLSSHVMVGGIPEIFLEAICLGSVFFGGMTYIGNGPNFIIRAIAEENGIKMPGFFAYIYKFSLIVLLPVFLLTILFL